MSQTQPTSTLASQYRAADVEPAVAKSWDASQAFHADPSNPGSAYSIVIPPPNVTAALHMGHALNNTLQDILTRYHRMRGFNTCWFPGTDHAGIATQTVVEKRVLQEEGKRRTDFEREDFVQKIQVWKDEYEQRITDQLKAMGCSCDWERQAFTLDDVRAKAVREAFFQLFKDGLIYRGKRLVNWDPATQTALADDEVEMQEIDGHFYYMKYPLVDAQGNDTGEFATVATTRPETMLGDTAVAVNPNDEAHKHLIGRNVKLPIVNRIIPIIGDDYVVIPNPESDDAKAKYASGFLKVTPAHDPNDYEIGQRHNLPIINVMAPDGTISREHGWPAGENIHEAAAFLGMDRFEARKAIIVWFRENGLLEEVKPYRHTVGHSYRSHVPIEPYLSDQWYVKVTDDRLAGAALRAMALDQKTTPAKDNGGTDVSSVNEPKARTITDKLAIHKRHLPHWQMGGSTYFVTFRLKEGKMDERERDIVLQACRHWHSERATVHLITVMPDHVHLLLTPHKQDDQSWYDLAKLIQSIKSFSAHAINKHRNRTGGVWQEEYFDRIVRDEKEFEEKWEYMCMNPVKAGLVSQPEAYAFTCRPDAKQSSDSALQADDGRDVRPTSPASPASPTSPTSPTIQGDTTEADWEGGLRFYPPRYAKTFEHWHENIRDWCISRQLWWGHRIPVWTMRLSHASIGTSRNPAEIRERYKQKVADYFSACGLTDDVVLKFHDQMIDGSYPLIVCSRSPRADEPLTFLKKQHFHHQNAATANFGAASAQKSERDTFQTTFGDDALKSASGLCSVITEIEQDPDVLDTWFSSALWPLSTMGWPEETAELAKWNPTSVLCTAREIITLWVSRMVMFNLYFKNQLPFKDVFIHAMIQDGHGQKMSKSLGNGVDPIDIIHSHGSDAMRYTLANMTTHTQDVRMPVDMVDPHTDKPFTPKFIRTSAGHLVAAPVQESPDDPAKKIASSFGVSSGQIVPTKDMPLARNSSEKFDLGRNFANKLWNATRFALTNLESCDGDFQPDEPGRVGPRLSELTVVSHWILSKLARTVRTCDKALANYEFATYSQALYDFFWRDLCDWYIEAIKPAVRQSHAQQHALATCMDVSLRLLHPVMPFITERLFTALNETFPTRGVEGIIIPPAKQLVTAPWPTVEDVVINKQAEAEFGKVQEIVTMIREVRTTMKVPPRERVEISSKVDESYLVPALMDHAWVEHLANVEIVEMGTDVAKPENAAVVVRPNVELYLHNQLDVEAERERLTKRQADIQKSVKTLQGRLSNESYVSKAPEHLVQQTRDQLTDAQAELAGVEKQLAQLDD